jgi:hypothetical protein
LAWSLPASVVLLAGAGAIWDIALEHTAIRNDAAARAMDLTACRDFARDNFPSPNEKLAACDEAYDIHDHRILLGFICLAVAFAAGASYFLFVPPRLRASRRIWLFIAAEIPLLVAVGFLLILMMGMPHGD